MIRLPFSEESKERREQERRGFLEKYPRTGSDLKVERPCGEIESDSSDEVPCSIKDSTSL